MKLWIDTGSCEYHAHFIERTDDGWVVTHADQSECEDTEFQITEDASDGN